MADSAAAPEGLLSFAQHPAPQIGERHRERRSARDALMLGVAVLDLALLLAAPSVAAELALTAAFVAEYAWSLVRPSSRYPTGAAFLRSTWFDLVSLAPVLPGLEGARVADGLLALRFLRLLRALRLLEGRKRWQRAEAALETYLVRSRLAYVIAFVVAVVLACALAVWTLEPANFPGYDDAVWWAVVTLFTVGYGDFVPKTDAGRVAGVVLMVVGFSLLTVLSATLSSALVERKLEERFSQQDWREAVGLLAKGPPALPQQLEALARLRLDGRLSEAEFAAAKDRLLR